MNFSDILQGLISPEPTPPSIPVEPSVVPALEGEALLNLLTPEARAAYQPVTPEEIDALTANARANAPEPAPFVPATPPVQYTEQDYKQAAAESKAQKLQETFGNQGFQFTVDKNGQMVITNTPETRSMSIPTKAQLQVPTNFQATMQQMLKTEDPVQRAEMMSQLTQQAAEYQTRLIQDVTSQAEARIGVPQLESLLAQNEQLDRQHPLWAKEQSDSKQTEQIRNQLNQARLRAGVEAEKMLRGNVGLTSIKSQMVVAQEIYNRANKVFDRKEEFDFRKTAEQQIKAQELLSEIGPEGISRMSIIDPSVEGKTPEEVAFRVKSAVKANKEIASAITAPDEELPALTFLGNNEAAGRILASKEAQKTGKSLEEVTASMEKFKADMLAPADKIKKQIGVLGIPSKEATAMVDQIKLTERGGTKESKLQAMQMRYNLTRDIYTKQAETKFLTNMTGWGITDPEILSAMEASAAADGSTNVVKVLQAYTSGSTGLDRTLKQNKFFAALDTAAKAKNGSLMFNLSPEDMRVRVQAEMVQSSVFDTLMDKVSPYRVINRGVMQVTKPVEDFFGGKQ